jgi:N-acetylglucosaminyldiphosphoundecaprenol N-acetyl-beta-D-mannosaminyltransferase
MSTLAPDDPAVLDLCPADLPRGRRVSILGVHITDLARRRAIELLERLLRAGGPGARSVYFVNAHTLNLAAADPAYRDVLNGADYVLGDGTGVRWAARLRGVRLHDNLCGTDLVPGLFSAAAGRGYRYFLLGGDQATVDRASRYADETFEGWTQTGRHHGYLADAAESARAARQINESRADLLLVGMGNPLQECWIDVNRHRLEVPLALGVGGLFTYWAGGLRRAPRWLRRWGAEWLGILAQQPHKARRYLVGNPLFLWRMLRWTPADRQSRR